MALYAVYYQTGVSPLDGAPLCTIDLVTQVEATAIAKQQELTDAGLVAWHEQIQYGGRQNGKDHVGHDP